MKQTKESLTVQRDALCAALVTVLDAFPLDGMDDMSDEQLSALGFAYGLLENIAANGGSNIKVPKTEISTG